MAGRFVISKSTNGRFFFNLQAGNNKPILTSELYADKASALAGIASVRVNAPIDSRYIRKTSKDNKPFFVLTAANGLTIGKSETYDSTVAMENGIKSVKQNAPGATLVDLTV